MNLDRFKADMPTDVRVTRKGYDFVELRWKHYSSFDAYYQHRFVLYVESNGDWLARRYVYTSRFARIEGLQQNKTYHLSLYSERAGFFMQAGFFVSIDVEAIPLCKSF